MTQPKRPLTLWQRLWRELLEPILFAVVITQFIATLVGVDGTSMMPNLRHGERVFVPKWEPWLHKVGIGDFQRGDILIFKPPPGTDRRSFPLLPSVHYRPFLIKRLIGLPGDKLRIEKGIVFVNGKKLNGSFTTDYWQEQGCWDTTSSIANNMQPGAETSSVSKEFVVPPGHYFLMGDNRTEFGSKDSRAFGPIPLRDIAGRAAAVVWPIMRKENARYNCGNSDAGAVELSGPSQLNWRVLSRPEAFRELNAK